MPRRFTTQELAACGTVTATELESVERGTYRFRRTRYVWRPSAQIERQLPRDFELAIDAISDSEGVRRFRDADGTTTHIFRGFAAGVAVLDRLRRFSAADRLKYRPPFFIYQYVQEMHAHLDCNFRSKASLVIKRGSRSDDAERNVLPLDLGYDSAGRGPQWNIDRLLHEGTEAAADAGIARATIPQQIAYGFFAAARRNPLRRSARDLRTDIRRALFDTEAIIAALGRRLTAIVKDRLSRLLDSHLDDSTDDFNDWYFPAGGRNLIRAIARQPNRSGGVLPNEDVTGVLLHLAWDAYGQLSECLGAFGQAFIAALPEPLSRREQTLFDLSMMPHRYFGGLPRYLLMERIEFLQPALSALLTDPGDRELVGALHRLLAWYPEMVRKRREADRLSKQRRPQRARRRDVTGNQELLDSDLTADRQMETRYRRRRRNSSRRSDRD